MVETEAFFLENLSHLTKNSSDIPTRKMAWSGWKVQVFCAFNISKISSTLHIDYPDSIRLIIEQYSMFLEANVQFFSDFEFQSCNKH
jgi:hypothetical protein